MLYDIDFSGLIGIGILIGLPLILTFLSEEKFNIITVLIYMTIINAFLVSVNILPLWTQVMFIIIMVGSGITKLKSENTGGL